MEKHERAVELVRNYLKKTDTIVHEDEIKLVWYTKTLQNWKAMVADISSNGKYFEVTYNGDTQETYIDVYQKLDNLVVKGL